MKIGDQVWFDISQEGTDGEIFILKDQRGEIVKKSELIETKWHIHWFSRNKTVSLYEENLRRAT